MDAMERIERTLGSRPRSLAALHGGCVAEVYRADFASGERLAIKVDAGPVPRLDIEAAMLRTLQRAGEALDLPLPVPEVVAFSADVLVLDYIEHAGGPSDEGEREFAEMLAGLHSLGTTRFVRGFGLDRDTLIGPLDQPNAPSESWAVFYRDHRLLHFARMAERAGSLPAGCMGRLEKLCDAIERELDHYPSPSLIHGDLWSGNVLWHHGRVAAIIDPAVYVADAEVELAFIALMGNVGRAFWGRYEELRPIGSGDAARRRQVYQLYPLLVHAVLFGRSYGSSVDQILRGLGY